MSLFSSRILEIYRRIIFIMVAVVCSFGASGFIIPAKAFAQLTCEDIAAQAYEIRDEMIALEEAAEEIALSLALAKMEEAENEMHTLNEQALHTIEMKLSTLTFRIRNELWPLYYLELECGLTQQGVYTIDGIQIYAPEEDLVLDWDRDGIYDDFDPDPDQYEEYTLTETAAIYLDNLLETIEIDEEAYKEKIKMFEWLLSEEVHKEMLNLYNEREREEEMQQLNEAVEELFLDLNV